MTGWGHQVAAVVAVVGGVGGVVGVVGVVVEGVVMVVDVVHHVGYYNGQLVDCYPLLTFAVSSMGALFVHEDVYTFVAVNAAILLELILLVDHIGYYTDDYTAYWLLGFPVLMLSRAERVVR